MYKKWVPAALLLSMTLLAYSSVLSADFIWDDDFYVVDNECLRDFDGLISIWVDPGKTPQYYPLVFTLFWVQFKLWGLAPLGYHLVNIVLHGANAVLLRQSLSRLNISAAFWVAALFALHPVHVESVAWVTELKNVLSTFFALIAFLLYWKFHVSSMAKRGYIYYNGSLSAFLLALLSKSIVGSLPAVILLLIWWQRGKISRIDVVRLAPFFLMAILTGWNTARLEISHVLASGPEWDFSFVERVLIAGRAISFYVTKLVWPDPLAFNYERWQVDEAIWWQYLYPLGVIAVAVVLWVFRAKVGRGALAGYLFFVGVLFPALGFFNVYPMRYSFVADHFQYVASIGLITVIACGICRFVEMYPRFTSISRCLALVVLLLMAYLTWNQGWIYQSRMTLFTDSINKNPKSWLSYSNRARDYALMGREDLALNDIENSLAINPADADSLQVRGAIALKNRDFERAIRDMSKAIEISPEKANYYRNRSLAFRNAGMFNEALVDATKMITLTPNDPGSYLHRALLHSNAGDLTAAELDVRMAEKMGLTLNDNEKKHILSPDSRISVGKF